MVEKYKADIAVLGGGPGGYAAAILAARLKARVVLIEKNKIGGTCLNVGCIPTKALKRCSDAYSQAKSLEQYGVHLDEVCFNFSEAMNFKEQVVNQLVMGVEYLVKANNVTLIKGTGKLVDSHKLVVTTEQGEEEITAENIIIATGAEEIEIPGFETDGVNILNSTQMLSIKKLPKRLVIIGGGVIGVEFAAIFRKMGVEITLVELTSHLIPTEDRELSENLQKSLEKEGIAVYTECSAQAVNRIGENNLAVKVKFKDEEAKKLTCDQVLVCVGRKANTRGIGLETVGVQMERGTIVTDKHMQTNIDNIYAVGDITGSIQLAHVAYSEARAAVLHIREKAAEIDYTAVPRCIFTTPEIASVGLTEKAARENYNNVKVTRFPFVGNGKALIEGYTAGFIKMIADGETERILGVSIVGERAPELIAEVTLAIHKKMQVKDIIETIHAHPTLSEIMGEVSLAQWGLNLHSM